MIKYNKDDIECVTFITENGEGIITPHECFKELLIIEVNNKEFELSAKIIDKGMSFGGINDSSISPISRLTKYNDISHIMIELVNGKTVKCDMLWSDLDYDTNDFQTFSLINYKELNLSISRENLKLSLKDVLQLDKDTVVVDSDKNEYTITEENGDKYLKDTLVSLSLLNSTFTIKNN